MARIFDIKAQKDEVARNIIRYFQSGNINFLLGSGASQPSIKTSGNIESEIDKLFKEGKNKEANRKIYSLLSDVQLPNNSLIKGENLFQLETEDAPAFKKRQESFETTKRSYRGLLKFIETLLIERDTNLLPKQANVFTTNYDLFLEDASNDFSALRLSDGFIRNLNLRSQFNYSSHSFFHSLSNRGNLYDYTVEVPTVNLIKIHGSLSWQRLEQEIIFAASERLLLDASADDDVILAFNSEYTVVLPQQGKFRETLLDRVYYDLLRIYSNSLEKENALLLAFGFSFDDRHIREITERALRNPTLLLVISAYDQDDVVGYQEKFAAFNNVIILAPAENELITLAEYNVFLQETFRFKEKASR